jgi:endonuclease/exonuclease/phosphatase (EEP) superfamily protein YafD
MAVRRASTRPREGRAVHRARPPGHPAQPRPRLDGLAALIVRKAVDVLLCLAAAGTVLATLLSFAAKDWWVFELITHFRPQLCAASLVLALGLAVSWRHKVLALALFGAALVNGWPFVSYVRSASASASAAAAQESSTVGTVSTSSAAGPASAPSTAGTASTSPAGGPASAPSAAGTAFTSPAGGPAPASSATRASSADDSTAATTLDVLSVNVLWRNDTYAALLDIIEAESPDIVVAEELTPAWRRGLAALDARYAYRLLVPRADPYGIGLWSRYPLAAEPIPLETTTALDARVTTPRGEIRLIGLHLRAPTSPAKAAERVRQFADLDALTRGEALPLVVVGDFNSTPYSPYFSDWLADAGLRDAHGAGFGITWPTFLPILGIPIDHCVVSPSLGVAAFRRLPAFGSDHYPILCRLTLEQSR